MGNDVVAGFEPRSGESWRDPFAMYAALREHDPVHHVTAGQRDYWVLSRHEDVRDAARDTERFSSAKGLTFYDDDVAGAGLDEISPMVFLDPPEHGEFRRLVARGFTPRAVTAIEPEVRRFVTERLDELLASGGGDVVATLFKPLPTRVVRHYLGVPIADREQFDGWVHAIVGANAASGGLTGGAATVAQTVAEIFEYFTALIDRRRREPGDDVISELVASGDGAGVSPMRILGFAFTMITGGNDTSTGLLGVGCALLSERPDQRALLGERPELVTNAVTELLRLTSPVQGLARTTTRDVTIGDTTIPAGRKVMLLYASANRDERVFGADAATLDVTRPAGPIMTFGHGAHYCLGAAAARLMGTVALEELIARCPNFTVDADNGRFAPGHFVRRYESLPFDPGG